MKNNIYNDIENSVTGSMPLSIDQAMQILDVGQLDTLTLLHLAYRFRHQYFGRAVMLHILNNVQNGLCSEDCRYCAQSTTSSALIEEYPMKSDEEIFAEAAAACRNGAGRYCMVFSGSGPTDERIDHLVRIIQEIKRRHKMEVCVSPGVITREHAEKLKKAGLDRLNHNLNTSEAYYRHICTSHRYEDRVKTVHAAHAAGLAVCSGVIVGMGESHEDVYAMALKLHEISAESIPVNFLIPIPGIAVKGSGGLTPEYCLRVLCLFRFLNPKADIRMAAGREIHLRDLQPLGLYAATSLFLQGYLNAAGAADKKILQIIKDMGFSIRSEVSLDGLLSSEDRDFMSGGLKGEKELRPFKSL